MSPLSFGSPRGHQSKLNTAGSGPRSEASGRPGGTEPPPSLSGIPQLPTEKPSRPLGPGIGPSGGGVPPFGRSTYPIGSRLTEVRTYWEQQVTQRHPLL